MDYLTYLKDNVVLGDSGIGVRNKSERKKYSQKCGKASRWVKMNSPDKNI